MSVRRIFGLKIFGSFVYHVPRDRFVLKVSIAIGKTAALSLLLRYSILSIPGNVYERFQFVRHDLMFPNPVGPGNESGSGPQTP